MKELIPKIGLEIHLELKTKTKMFCSCLNNPEEIIPNKNICPICVGHPGVLPTLNKKAVIFAYSLAKALKMKLNNKCYFSRKHYFYPDLPKNYQISQYELPIGENGFLELIRENFRKKVRIRRVHLEEDTAKNIHMVDYSLIDFNRAGIPLLEIVTEPDLNSPEEVEIFAEEFVLLLRYLNISEIKAEKGGIRFEANVSLGEGNQLGTKVEIKNIGTIQALKTAVKYEISRQEKTLSEGKNIFQETRGFDESKGITFAQRSKEEAEDYRYFPEPDLPPLFFGENLSEELANIEIPSDKKDRFIREYNLTDKEVVILTKSKFLSHFFEESFSELSQMINDFDMSKKLILNYLINDLWGLIQQYVENEESLKDIESEIISPHEFAHLLFMFHQGKISSRGVKEILAFCLTEKKRVENILQEKEKISDLEIIEKIMNKVLAENPKAVEDYLKGKKESFEFLIGKMMKESKGRIDPYLGKKLLLDKLTNLKSEA